MSAKDFCQMFRNICQPDCHTIHILANIGLFPTYFSSLVQYNLACRSKQFAYATSSWQSKT